MSDNNTQAIFMEALDNLKEYARVNGQVVNKNDVLSYFKGIDLDDKKMEIIYGYLMANSIKVEGEDNKNNAFVDIIKESTLDQKEKDEEENVKKIIDGMVDYSQDESYISEYKEELNEFEAVTQKTVLDCIQKLSQNEDENSINKMLYFFMNKIPNTIKPFMGKGVSAGDLIQEATLSVLAYLKSMRWQYDSDIASKAKSENKDDVKEVLKYIEDEIESDIAGSLNMLIDEQKESAKVSNKILEKVNFVNDWAKRLKKELGRKPTVDELSEKTGLPKEDIIEAVNFSADKIEDINADK